MRQRHARQPLDQVERSPDRGVADGMHCDGDPVRGRGAHRLVGFALADYRHPAIATALVRLEHPCGAAAETAVEKELHAAQPEPRRARSTPCPALNQGGERRHRRVEEHPEPQLARLLETSEGPPRRFRPPHCGYPSAPGDAPRSAPRAWPGRESPKRVVEPPWRPVPPRARAAGRWARPPQPARSSHRAGLEFPARRGRRRARRCSPTRHARRESRDTPGSHGPRRGHVGREPRSSRSHPSHAPRPSPAKGRRRRPRPPPLPWSVRPPVGPGGAPGPTWRSGYGHPRNPV